MDDIRQQNIDAFLKSNLTAKFSIQPLAGDASSRKYWRIDGALDRPLILMDAPQDKGESLTPFLSVARILKERTLSAPDILAVDHEHGFILMEDFGNALFFDLVEADSSLEQTLYDHAIDALHVLWNPSMDLGLAAYGPTEMTQAVHLVEEWYCQDPGQETVSKSAFQCLEKLDWSEPAIVLRDYHAQNLIWLPDRDGIAKVGQLDFQDAAIGHKYYDVVSLLFDARRDVSQATIDHILHRLRAKDPNQEMFDLSIATLSAQRNLRILGVFARLCMRDGKVGYIDLIPRVWKNLQHDLNAPGLDQLKQACQILPRPAENYLNKLRSLCKTHQTH